jgi:HK97 gp10 family phage protein
MSVKIGFEVTGFAELHRKLRLMPKNIQRNTVKRAVRAGAKPVIAAMKATVPVGETRNLQKSIGKREKSYVRSSTFFIVIGPRTQAPKHFGFHGHWLEYGTGMRYTKSGAYRGFITATHFMERAWATTEDIAKGIIMTKLWDGVRREAEKRG